MQSRFIIIFFTLLSLHHPANSQVAADSGFSYPRLTVGIGLGVAAANSICIPCAEKEIIPGYSLLTAVGVIINKRFIAEAAVLSWISLRGHKNPNNSRLNLMARVHYFPFDRNRISFIAGIGAGNYFFTPQKTITTSDGYRTLGSVIGTGFACTGGAGYEFDIGKKISLTPAVNFYFCFPGNLAANEIYVIHNAKTSVIMDGGVTFRFNPPFKNPR